MARIILTYVDRTDKQIPFPLSGDFVGYSFDTASLEGQKTPPGLTDRPYVVRIWANENGFRRTFTVPFDSYVSIFKEE